jgi:hypothetical protein
MLTNKVSYSTIGGDISNFLLGRGSGYANIVNVGCAGSRPLAMTGGLKQKKKTNKKSRRRKKMPLNKLSKTHKHKKKNKNKRKTRKMRRGGCGCDNSKLSMSGGCSWWGDNMNNMNKKKNGNTSKKKKKSKKNKKNKKNKMKGGRSAGGSCFNGYGISPYSGTHGELANPPSISLT